MSGTSSPLFFTCILLAEADGGQWGWLAGVLGGVLGAVIGIGGGVLGTYFSIRNTKTAAERRFVIRYGMVIWLAVLALVLLPVALSQFGLIPVWLQWALFALFFVLLVPSVGWANRRQAYLCGSQGPGGPLRGTLKRCGNREKAV
jgi:Ca2+/Na+ antiporter